MVDALVLRALEAVLADVRATGAPVPRVLDDPVSSPYPDQVGALLRAADGTGSGVFLMVGAAETDRHLAATEAVQEWVVEELWPRDSNWPVCPDHPTTHPMQAHQRDGLIVWCCPRSGRTVAEVGTLGRGPA